MNYRKLVVLVMMAIGGAFAEAGEIVKYIEEDFQYGIGSHFERLAGYSEPGRDGEDTYIKLMCGRAYRGKIYTTAAIPQFKAIHIWAKQPDVYGYGYEIQTSETGADYTWTTIKSGKAPTDYTEIEASIATAQDLFVRVRITTTLDNPSSSYPLYIDKIAIYTEQPNCDNCFPIHIE